MTNDNRIYGYDFARALAVFGMIMVNFKTVMYLGVSSSWIAQAIEMLEGRAAALFVILAGVGVSLFTNRARLAGNAIAIKKKQWALVRRSVLLIVIGLAYSPIWPADILHFYGFYILLGVFFIPRSDKALWRGAIAVVGGFLIMLLLIDYVKGWDLDNLEYLDFWTIPGMIRHIFFNGFHPVLPWAAFLLLGMWLGRQDVNDPAFRKGAMLISLGVWIATELASKAVQWYMAGQYPPEAIVKIEFLFSTGPMPPMPQYMLAGASLAVFIIMASISICKKFAGQWWVAALTATGQMSLSFYVLHVVLGMGIAEELGFLEGLSIEIVAIYGLVFNIFCVVFAVLWQMWQSAGPLEWVFRKLVR